MFSSAAPPGFHLYSALFGCAFCLLIPSLQHVYNSILSLFVSFIFVKTIFSDAGCFGVGLQYILDSEKKKDEGFAQIGYCEFGKNNKDRKEVQIPHDNCNTGHEVQAIPNVLREEIWRSASVAEI